MEDEEVTFRDKLGALRRVARYRPRFAAFVVGFSFFVALFEAIGLTFLIPIVEVAQEGESVGQGGGGGRAVEVFLTAYDYLGVPFTLEYILLGVAVVMGVRYTSTFLLTWFSTRLHMGYERHLKERAFTGAVDAEVAYYDREGSDDVLNAVITQTRFAGKLVDRIVRFLQQSLLAVMYLAVAFLLAPLLSVLAAVALGGITYLIRNVIEPGYVVGDRVAAANENIQESVQAGTQGIRDVKLFGMDDEIRSDFRDQLETYVDSNVDLQRNKAAIRNFYKLTVVVVLFVLVYAAIQVFSLSFAALTVFLFAMVRLAFRVSRLNSKFYNIEGELPHLVRTHRFVDELDHRREGSSDSKPVPDPVESITYDDVSFAYETGEERVLNDVSFEVDRGEFVAFVGQSGAGKSTIVALLTRMYDPDSGEIAANEIPIEKFDLAAWRDRIGTVRQDPYVFNETLRYNLTIGNRSATQEEINRVAEIAKVDAFLDDLPEGYDTVLGDEGVQLSGGQRQRISLARALLTDAEVLVLDEATSDLDSHLEKEIQDNIESLEEEYTIFAIAHRLSTVKNADRIYTLKAGEITEAGAHEELVDTGGKYAELYSIQS